MKCIFFFSMVVLVACTASKPVGDQLPKCIAQHIDSLKNQPKQNPAASVEQYLFRGKNVYLFSAPCCDFYNVLVDENCNAICAPSGGFTGKGDGKCPEFKDEAKFVKLVWKDNR